MDGRTTQLSAMRLYGSAIALVSGGYSLTLATRGTGMTGSAWLMLLLGAVVIVHGIALLTPLAGRIGDASGPLMIGYATAMLLNQLWTATMGGTMRADGGMMQAGADGGMVALAVLMLASGAIMTARRETPSAESAIRR